MKKCKALSALMASNLIGIGLHAVIVNENAKTIEEMNWIQVQSEFNNIIQDNVQKDPVGTIEWFKKAAEILSKLSPTLQTSALATMKNQWVSIKNDLALGLKELDKKFDRPASSELLHSLASIFARYTPQLQLKYSDITEKTRLLEESHESD